MIKSKKEDAKNSIDKSIEVLFAEWFFYREQEKKFMDARVKIENEILQQLGLSYALEKQLTLLENEKIKFYVTPSITYSLNQQAVKEAIDQEDETALALQSVVKVNYQLYVSLYKNSDEKIARLIRPFVKIKFNKPSFKFEEKGAKNE